MFAIDSLKDYVRVWHWLLKRLCLCLALIVYMIVWVFDIDSEELFNWLALIPRKPTIGIELYLDCYEPELLLWSRAFTTHIEQLRVLLKRKFHYKLVKSYTLAAGMLIYIFLIPKTKDIASFITFWFVYCSKYSMDYGGLMLNLNFQNFQTLHWYHTFHEQIHSWDWCGSVDKLSRCGSYSSIFEVITYRWMGLIHSKIDRRIRAKLTSYLN